MKEVTEKKIRQVMLKNMKKSKTNDMDTFIKANKELCVFLMKYGTPIAPMALSFALVNLFGVDAACEQLKMAETMRVMSNPKSKDMRE